MLVRYFNIRRINPCSKTVNRMCKFFMKKALITLSIIAFLTALVLCLNNYGSIAIPYYTEEQHKKMQSTLSDHTVTSGVLSASARDLINYAPLDVLPSAKNPCFYSNSSGQRILKCLPYFFLAGLCACFNQVVDQNHFYNLNKL